jgi:hypothetical protein
MRASARLEVASFDGMDFMFLFLGCGGGLMGQLVLVADCWNRFPVEFLVEHPTSAI